MTTDEFPQAWLLLKKQVKTLKVPWLEKYAADDRDPFKVLISCILSLRTQDKTTGEASERLFAMASSPHAMASLTVSRIQETIYPVGFYKVKAKTIKAICQAILSEHRGMVPDDIDALLKLKGVGRKTANLVITLGFDKYGICVDTHVHRITNRWGYVKTKTPEETEYALREKLPRKYWKPINGLLVAFGQNICKPVSPLCSICSLFGYCAKVGVVRSR
ncbi:MAG: endonuclease III [Nitrospirae bacterium]|nr:endonuclease III [Nitrospirota bacterium]